MDKFIGKNIIQSLSGKYSQKFKSSLTIYNRCTQNYVKKVIQKTAEATGDLTDNKSADKITKAWRSSPKNNSETFTNEYDKEIPKERYISPEETEKAIDDLRLI